MIENKLPRSSLAFVLAAMGTLAPAQEKAPDALPSPTPSGTDHAEVNKALPAAGSLTARIVQLNAGLVLEREEGPGLFPAEPSRFTFRGGSWTQTRVEIDGFDVTDPIVGGRPIVWGALELGEVDVRTDSKGTVLVHDHPTSLTLARTHFLAEGNLGVFGSNGAHAGPIPSLARGHSLFDGVLSVSGSSSSGATSASGAVSGAHVSRSERESEQERATQRLGFEGRLNHIRGEDRFQGLALYQDGRAPFGFTTAQTRESGLLLGAAWSQVDRVAGTPRRGAAHGTRVRASYLRGHTTDPQFGSSLPFERLVDGPAGLQAPHQSTGQKFQVEGTHHAWDRGGAFSSSLVARFGRATSERRLSQPIFQALERLNGLSAREWTFLGASALGVVETRASLSLDFGIEVSARTGFRGSIGLERLAVGDRDGERILGSTELIPSLRFEWRKSDTTELYAEASMDTPPTPLVSYEAVTRNVPTVSARLWRDLNGDGRATPSELGVEVVRRSPGSMSVDPDLAPPNLRRVIVGYKTKVRGILIEATGFARRDRDLLETALDPQGSEIGRTRNLPDPSGDIVGASDDQILPIVEESTRSFSSSRYLFTNPAGHRALGEGAELAFETNSRHVHWGLRGAAFRVSGRGGNRGLRVTESDFGVVGESFDTTNADTFGYGRLFFDRAYSLRMYLTANNLRGFTFGAIGRYDDGQPFARLVIQNDLPQGPDFVQAIPRGRARLHYTLSVDARLAKRFRVSTSSVEVSASVFNALGSRFEAEEQVVWLSDYRRITMVQPPRAFVIGLRIER